MKTKIVRHIEARGKNKRIFIYLLDKNSEKTFEVITKTLINFKTRHILKTETIYSIETFAVLCDLMKFFLSDSEIENKILLKELN